MERKQKPLYFLNRTAVCIFLRRLARPSRFYDLETIFGMHQSALSEIFWDVAHSLYASKISLGTSFRYGLWEERGKSHSVAVKHRGGYLPHCAGFLDDARIKPRDLPAIMTAKGLFIADIRG